MAGEGYPARVGASLYASLSRSSSENYFEYDYISNILITFSIQSFENIAVKLLKNKIILKHIRNILENLTDIHNKNRRCNLYDAEAAALTFERGMLSMYDSYVYDSNHSKRILKYNTNGYSRTSHVVILS